VTTYELCICIRLGLKKNVLPEPPITRIFLFLAYFGFFGLPDIISLSVCVSRMLFSNTVSMYSAISLAVPHEAFCQVFLELLTQTFSERRGNRQEKGAYNAPMDS